MKKFTIEVTFTEGNDEFWESKYSKAELYEVIQQELEDTLLRIEDIKITKIIDFYEYDRFNYEHDIETENKEKEDNETKS